MWGCINMKILFTSATVNILIPNNVKSVGIIKYQNIKYMCTKYIGFMGGLLLSIFHNSFIRKKRKKPKKIQTIFV